MLLAPSETQIEVGIRKFRQAAYKFEFKSKRMQTDAVSKSTEAGRSNSVAHAKWQCGALGQICHWQLPA